MSGIDPIALHGIVACPSCHLRFLQLAEVIAHLEADHPHRTSDSEGGPTGRVTVPLDPDRSVPAALAVAEAVARQVGLEVDLVAVPGLAGRDLTGTFLRERARSLRPDRTDFVRWHTLDGDRPADAVNRHAAATGADLLCLSTRSSHGPRHLLFGSVAEAVLLGADRPVLLVGPAVTAAAAVRHVVAAVDGSPEASRALVVADRLRKVAGADLHLIGVVPSGGDVPDDVREAGVLLRAASSLESEPSGWDVLHADDPAEAIAGYANQRDDVIVVTGTHNRGGFHHVLRDGVARAVVGASRHPVLVVPPAADPAGFLAGRLAATTA